MLYNWSLFQSNSVEQYCNTYVFSTYLPKDKFYLQRKVKFIAGSAQYVGTDRGSGETKPPLITSITIMPLASTKSEAISHKIGSRSNIYDQARVDGSRTDKQKIMVLRLILWPGFSQLSHFWWHLKTIRSSEWSHHVTIVEFPPDRSVSSLLSGRWARADSMEPQRPRNASPLICPRIPTGIFATVPFRRLRLAPIVVEFWSPIPHPTNTCPHLGRNLEQHISW